MTTPPDTSSVPSTSVSSSPRIRADHSPVRLRQSTGSDSNDLSPRARLSPTLSRSYNPNDPDVRERQRTMDADMAIQLSRARGNTVSISPVVTSPLPLGSPSADGHLHFPNLSLAEQHELDAARGVTPLAIDVDNAPQFQASPAPDRDLLTNHLSAGHDPSLLVSLNIPDMEDATMGGLPMYQATVDRADRPRYDFSLMEDFANAEKARLGIRSPAGGFNFRPVPSSSTHALDSSQGEGGQPPAQDFTLPFTLPRVRQRKLSQSAPGPRRGKMALFEQPSAPPPALASRAPHLATGTTLSAVPSYENLSDVTGGPGGLGNGDLGIGIGGGAGSGHDRPYRFSFYSNALSATIHARSLCELPAEGQSFEDLFLGQGNMTPKTTNGIGAGPNNLGRMGVGGMGGGANGPVPRSAASSPIPIPAGVNGDRAGGISKMYPNERRNGNGVESYTWWLDVLSPTDEEMKLLSKVFSIHPLTTEDIQMEETREKIELFRNYYLVCFRGFDQDPYSPTHLEPLNMYIIVFREGILSFHFRPTPHPQNVRRRIKQLKDYISVTSDWISYALIDDITDAFGPLIQSIEYEVDSIDELVLILKEAEQSDMLRRIGTCRKKVMGLLRLMGNKADVVKGLAKRCNENWRVAPTSDIGLYLSDIQDHLITMTQNLNHYEKILSRSHSNYLAQISIEMTDANNQINDVLSKLTALGTVLIPMNLITGLWGMNVHVPGQNVENLRWFGSIIGALAAFAIIAGWTTYKIMLRR